MAIAENVIHLHFINPADLQRFGLELLLSLFEVTPVQNGRPE
jgi:hypothetical protein